MRTSYRNNIAERQTASFRGASLKSLNIIAHHFYMLTGEHQLNTLDALQAKRNPVRPN